MLAAKAEAKAKAKAGAQDAARTRVDKCAWCGEQRQGWSDLKALVFYCEHCWSDYDALQSAGGEDYIGKVWHDKILEEDNIAAEGEDGGDGKQILEFTKHTLNQIDSKRLNVGSDDEDETVGPLPAEFKPTELNKYPIEFQQAHIIVIVDTSGSMRTNDVMPENAEDGAQPITRMTAAEALHHVKLCMKELAAGHGTHFVAGLTAAKSLLSGYVVGTPHLLIFSDGRPADGIQMLHTAQNMLQTFENLRIHAIGFGDGLDFEMLQQLTSIGRGSFAPSDRSVRALHSAFASVTSTVTATQTVTSRSGKSSSYSFKGRPVQSSGEDALPESKERGLKLRSVNFEPANQFMWSTKSSVSFRTRRRWLSFNGKGFKQEEQSRLYQHNPVSLRRQPFTQGGMRLVYCFRDSTIPLFAEQRRDQFAMQEAGTDARMVAKISKYTDGWHNSFEVVSGYAKSSAVARFYSRVFRLAVMDRFGWKGRSMARIIFVECYIYTVEEGHDALPPFMVGERYLPGVFRKYNGNHGYVDPDLPDSEIAQAFSHFTFEASRGKHMVLDLQGVHLDKGQRRNPHLILTDPQDSASPMPAASTTALTPATPTTAAATSGNSGSISDLRVADPDADLLAPLPTIPLVKSSPERTEMSGIQETSMWPGFTTRYPPTFGVPSGAKMDGPLSALMARSAESGRPDYDALLRRPSANQPVNGENLEANQPAMVRRVPSPNQPCFEGSQSQQSTRSEFRPETACKLSQKSLEVDTCESLEDSQSTVPTPLSEASSGASLRLGDETAIVDPPKGGKKSIVYGPNGKKFTLSASCRAHVIAAIDSEFSIPEEEQQLFQEITSLPNVDVYRVERKMDPRKLKFTQASVSPTFRDGRPIFDLLNDLNVQKVDPLRELEPLDVVWQNGHWRSLSNRRLWALKHCTIAMTGQPLFVRVRALVRIHRVLRSATDVVPWCLRRAKTFSHVSPFTGRQPCSLMSEMFLAIGSIALLALARHLTSDIEVRMDIEVSSAIGEI
ncbi:Alpha-protein kinase vwkA (von Willebrand factor A alpha-kinase) (vWF kinase) [Durusdinium trenchii]|uniref:Alpha-protein kinase vwkA (von Willebrand factor A alpha-kinase) (vWF kinase) n=1 Tax=Durusdinium trenchii TaxID=1381693 RepID=A0ABP0HQB0_9DINO